LYYDYQRWYDPSTGRFISQDPLPGYLSYPQSLNPYVYAANAPATLVDPTGLLEEGHWGCIEGEECGLVDLNAFWKEIESEGGIGEPSPSETGTITEPIGPPEPTIEPTTIEPSGGPGGAQSGLKGNYYEAKYVDEQISRGLDPTRIEVQKTFEDKTTGKEFRVDNYYEGSNEKTITEIKSGYVSGTRFEVQALDYQRVASANGAQLQYAFYGRASAPFRAFLYRHLIDWDYL